MNNISNFVLLTNKLSKTIFKIKSLGLSLTTEQKKKEQVALAKYQKKS